MRKYIVFVLALVCVFALVGCSKTQNDAAPPAASVEESQPMQEKNNPVQTDAVLKEPPALTVRWGDKTVEALQGTSSWRYQNEDGTSTGIEADSLHPLQAKEYMTPLELIPTPLSSVDPLQAYLLWNTLPDKVSVYGWAEEDWEQPTAQKKEIPVYTLMIDSEPATEPIFSIELQDGNYIYEVIAEWNRAELYGGTAFYSFYTVKQQMELTTH